MSKYIDKEKLRNKLEEVANRMTEELPDTPFRREHMIQRDAYRGLMYYVDRLRAEDVAPVRRGKWIPITGRSPRDKLDKCSECMYEMPRPGTNYCPNCGAKMESEDIT